MILPACFLIMKAYFVRAISQLLSGVLYLKNLRNVLKRFKGNVLSLNSLISENIIVIPNITVKESHLFFWLDLIEEVNSFKYLRITFYSRKNTKFD